MANVKRGMRLARRQSDAQETKIVNSKQKTAERSRRDVRMVTMLKAGSLPYTPTIMSWVSRQLGKPSNRVTEADIQTLTA